MKEYCHDGFDDIDLEVMGLSSDPKSLKANDYLHVNSALDKLAINKRLMREVVQTKTYSTLFHRFQEALGDNGEPNPFNALPTEIICEIGALTLTSSATSTSRLFAKAPVKSSKKGKEKVEADEIELEDIAQTEQEMTSERLFNFKKDIFNRLITHPQDILIDTKNGQIYFNK